MGGPLPSPSARSVAARVIERVLKDRAYAAAALDAEVERHPQLDPRDRALATEIVYGVLRTRGALLDGLRAHARKGLKERDHLAISHLLVAAYQIRFLSRVPAFAAVDEAVGAIRTARGPRVAGFSNALLRKVAGASTPRDLRTAILESVPGWLRNAVEASLGMEAAVELFGAGEVPGGDSLVSLRLRPNALESDWLRAAVAGRLSPLCRKVARGGDLRKRPEYQRGQFVIQEEAAQFVALALGARWGEKVLDACAGRGQKTTLLGERVGPEGQVWAADLHSSKLDALSVECRRLGLPEPHRSAVDWVQGTGDVPGDFERVLVDAPCSGVGTLRRRPELLIRLTPEDPQRLARQATEILRRAATRARPGGRVVFAVCSILDVECGGMIERVRDILEPVPFDAPEVHSVFGGEVTEFRLHPAAHGTDGFFVASFLRKG